MLEAGEIRATGSAKETRLFWSVELPGWFGLSLEPPGWLFKGCTGGTAGVPSGLHMAAGLLGGRSAGAFGVGGITAGSAFRAAMMRSLASSSSSSNSIYVTPPLTGLGALVDGVGGVVADELTGASLGMFVLLRAGVATGCVVCESFVLLMLSQMSEKQSVVPRMKILSAIGSWMSCFVKWVCRQRSS